MTSKAPQKDAQRKQEKQEDFNYLQKGKLTALFEQSDKLAYIDFLQRFE